MRSLEISRAKALARLPVALALAATEDLAEPFVNQAIMLAALWAG
jgi:hypothetical protein